MFSFLDFVSMVHSGETTGSNGISLLSHNDSIVKVNGSIVTRNVQNGVSGGASVDSLQQQQQFNSKFSQPLKATSGTFNQDVDACVHCISNI